MKCEMNRYIISYGTRVFYNYICFLVFCYFADIFYTLEPSNSLEKPYLLIKPEPVSLKTRLGLRKDK